MIASVFLGDVRVIRCISKMIVPIKLLWLCVSVFDFLIILFFFHFGTHMLTCKSFTHYLQIFYYSYYNVLLHCDLAITRNTCSSKSLINCLEFFIFYLFIRPFSDLWLGTQFFVEFDVWVFIMLLKPLVIVWYWCFLEKFLFMHLDTSLIPSRYLSTPLWYLVDPLGFKRLFMGFSW